MVFWIFLLTEPNSMLICYVNVRFAKTVILKNANKNLNNGIPPHHTSPDELPFSQPHTRTSTQTTGTHFSLRLPHQRPRPPSIPPLSPRTGVRLPGTCRAACLTGPAPMLRGVVASQSPAGRRPRKGVKGCQGPESGPRADRPRSTWTGEPR